MDTADGHVSAVCSACSVTVSCRVVSCHVLQLFVPGQVPPANTVMIAEQLPGLIVSGDVTDILNFGYWPSYNRAFFAQVRPPCRHIHIQSNRWSVPCMTLVGLCHAWLSVVCTVHGSCCTVHCPPSADI